MCEKKENLPKDLVLSKASELGVLMWECPREKGRLILRPAAMFMTSWPSVVKQQIEGLKRLKRLKKVPPELGITQEEITNSLKELEKVFKNVQDRFMAEILAA